MMHGMQSSRSQSLTATAYDEIRRGIIDGRFRPNERLVAADLAEILTISRTPVREALQMLEREGLVTPAKRGFVVREHTAREIEEIYEVRAALEGMATKLLVRQARAEDIEEIEALGAHHDELAHAPRSRLVDLNAAFHQTIIRLSGNALIAQLNVRIAEQAFNHGIGAMYSEAEALASVRGHARIIAAMRSGDEEAAARAAQQHCMETMAFTLSKIRPRGDSADQS